MFVFRFLYSFVLCNKIGYYVPLTHVILVTHWICYSELFLVFLVSNLHSLSSGYWEYIANIFYRKLEISEGVFNDLTGCGSWGKGTVAALYFSRLPSKELFSKAKRVMEKLSTTKMISITFSTICQLTNC